MKLLIEYLGYIIFGILSKIIFDKKEDINNNLTNNNSLRNSVISSIATMNNINNNNNDKQTKFQTIKLLLIASALFSIQLMARTILNFGSVWMLDLWIFNIFFVYIFMKFFLHTQIYKHQCYALIVIFALNFILMITCSSIRHKGISEYDEVAKNYGSYFYIALFYLS